MEPASGRRLLHLPKGLGALAGAGGGDIPLGGSIGQSGRRNAAPRLRGRGSLPFGGPPVSRPDSTLQARTVPRELAEG
jgi:hypothetical protein